MGVVGAVRGTSGGGTTPPVAAVSTVEVLSSLSTLSSASANTVNLTALVKNASNNGMAAVPVTFAASSGVLQSVVAATDANGVATAVLSTGADRSNRDITVTVTAGSVVKEISVPVTGTTVSVAGAGSILLGGQGTYSVVVRDSGGTGISGASVTVASGLGQQRQSCYVDHRHHWCGRFNYIANRSGSETLAVASMGVTSNFAVAISSEDFTFVGPSGGTEVFVNTPQTVTVRYLSGEAGVVGRTVNFSSTRGGVSASTAVTDSQGFAATTVASSTAGPATVTAQIAGGAQTSVALNFTAATPASIVLQVNPSAIATNAAGSSVNPGAIDGGCAGHFGQPGKRAYREFHCRS